MKKIDKHELRKLKRLYEDMGETKQLDYKFVCDELAKVEADDYHDFMMRGEREIFFAIMDRLGVRLEPPFNRDYTAGSR